MSRRFVAAENSLQEVEEKLISDGYSELHSILDEKEPSKDAIVVDNQERNYWYVQRKYYEKQVESIHSLCGELVGEWES